MVTYANPLDFRKISTIAREEKPTIMVGPPSFFWGYLNKSEPGDFKSRRMMVAGADNCPDALRDGYMKKPWCPFGGVRCHGDLAGISVNSPESTGLQLRQSDPGIKLRVVKTGEERSARLVRQEKYCYGPLS
jgi:acyl-[acyl-carrier-protein]-phospholipid O-acyltransferase/long-chain-fatty-acid--[acyl-carrier-protein] ligase